MVPMLYRWSGICISELAADFVYGVNELDEVLDFFLTDGAYVVDVVPGGAGECIDYY